MYENSLFNCNFNDFFKKETNEEHQFCDFEFDYFNCLNINCNGLKSLQKIPHTLKKLVNATLNKTQIVCSIDLSETGIKILNSDVFENFNQFILELVKINRNHEKSTLKLSFSNIESIESFKLPHLNTVLFISDSSLKKIQPQSLSYNSKIELNLLNVTANSVNWLNLLDSSRLKLLNLRNIPNMEEEFIDTSHQLFPIATIIDLKIYHTFLPILDENFFLFKTIKYIEQMEFMGCSIFKIKNDTFSKYKTRFRYLKNLILSNNNLTNINEKTFNGLSNLVLLDLDENPIEFIGAESFANLKKLKILSLNNNMRLIHLMANPAWLTNILNAKTDSLISEINLKSSLWSKDFCSLHFLFTSIKTSNINHDKVKNTSLANYTDKPRYLKIFLEEELEIDNEDDEIYCNYNFICKYSSTFSYFLWRIESLSSCSNILKLITVEKRCLFTEKIHDCESELAGK